MEWWVDGDPRWFRELLGPQARLHAQPAGDLGQRLAHAFGDAFRRRGGPVAVIGSDCPLLELATLEQLYRALDAGAEASLVPSDDGGYAALALARVTPEVFRDIPWSSERVLGATLGALGRAGREVALLPGTYDVDTPEALRRLAADLGAAPERAPATAARVARLGVEASP